MVAVALEPTKGAQGFNHYDTADRFEVDRTVEQASPDDYDALVLPGGVGNPDTLRMDENAVQSTGRSSSSRASSRVGGRTTCRRSVRS